MAEHRPFPWEHRPKGLRVNLRRALIRLLAGGNPVVLNVGLEASEYGLLIDIHEMRDAILEGIVASGVRICAPSRVTDKTK